MSIGEVAGAESAAITSRVESNGHDLSPFRTNIVQSDAEDTVLLPTGAVEDVNVSCRLIGMRLKCLDLVVLRVTAT
jgi:hypothetical protein